MKTYISRYCVFMGVLLILLCTGKVSSAYAVETALETETMAEHIKKMYEAENADKEEYRDYENVFALENQAASRDGDRLTEYLEVHTEGALYRCYAGHYISPENNLIILLSCEEPACLEVLEIIGFETEIEIKIGDYGSYFKTMALLKEINSRISRINIAVLKGEGTEAEIELMKYYPCTHYNHLTNSIWISVVTEDAETENHAISLFKKLVGNYSEIMFGTCKKQEVTASDCATVRPGRGFACNGYSFSTGYRAKYTENGTVYNGIVTAAHHNAAQETAYYYDSGNLVTIGKVTKVVYNNPVDAAFIRFNSNITYNQYIQYSSITGSTAQTHYLNGTTYSPAVGNTLYKSGGSTYRTSETISSVSSASYTSGIYFTDMIAVPGAIAGGGDSGGIAYRLVSGNSAGILGIVKAISNDVTLFIKASNINSILGLTSY